MKKTGAISGTGANSVNITGGKVRDIIVRSGLDEEAVNASLGNQTKQLTQALEAQGHAVTAEVVSALRTLIENKFVEYICDIRARQANSEESAREAVQKKFKELQDGTAVLVENVSATLNEKLVEGGKLLQSISELQDKAAYYAEERYNALYSRLDDIRERVEHINDREARKDLENISFLQKKLEYGHSALQSAEFDRAKKYFEAVTASNAGGSDLAAFAYFGMALAEWQIQLIWDDVKNSEQFILYNYDIDLSDKHGSYREAIDNATTEQADVFRKFVAKLRRAREKLYYYRDKELSYDCFICTKVTASENEQKTDDCNWIKEEKLYEVLTQSGSKPFYSEVVCKEYAAKKGTLEYESLIYYALSRARVMLLVCSEQKYLETPWVANEINRFRQFCKKRGENPLERIIVVHKDKAVELPSDLDERYQGWNRKETDVETIARVAKAAVADARRDVEEGWKYCPKCGKRYSLDMEECSSNQCPAYPVRTRLVGGLMWANILRDRDREEYERKIEKLKRERNAPPKAEPIAPPKVKFCVFCGTENPERAKICMECGKKIFVQTWEEVEKRRKSETMHEAKGPSEEPRPAPQPTFQPEPPSQPTPDYPTLENYDESEFEIEGQELKKYLKKDFSGEVKIPRGVTSIGILAFLGCRGITSIMIPESVVSIGSWAFCSCEGLNLITIPARVTSIGGWAFRDCKNLTIYCEASKRPIGWNEYWNPDSRPVVWVRKMPSKKSDQIRHYDKSEFEIEGQELKKYLKKDFSGEVKIPRGVTSIGWAAFRGCSRLTSIIIPDGVDAIEWGAFSGCNRLMSINIPDSTNLIEKYAFDGCRSLTSIMIPDQVTLIDAGAFNGCENLTIYCEANERPSGWAYNWNPGSRPVVWGYKKE